MRYYDREYLQNSAIHRAHWAEQTVLRLAFDEREAAHNATRRAAGANASAVLPRDVWFDFDTMTKTVMMGDEGRAWMTDLMPLAKMMPIGKIVGQYRMVGEAQTVVRSISGQVPVALDKVPYEYAGNPVPIFATGYHRAWREWQALQSENFDALSDDQFEALRKINRDMALYALDGDAEINFQGYAGAGIRTHANSKTINLGSAGGGANIDLSSAATTSDAVVNFFNGAFGAMLDANFITEPVNLYISNEIRRIWDRPYSGSGGFKPGSLRSVIADNSRINKIASTYELTGNEFFGFVPDSRYIRPLIGMPVTTTAMVRPNPTDNYNFLVMGAMGLEIRADINGRSGVFYSTDVD